MDTKEYPSYRLAKINIRLPHKLRGQLKKTAKKEGRTMNSQAVQLLAEGLARLSGNST